MLSRSAGNATRVVVGLGIERQHFLIYREHEPRLADKSRDVLLFSHHYEVRTEPPRLKGLPPLPKKPEFARAHTVQSQIALAIMVGVPGRSKACITCRKRRKGVSEWT